MTDLDVVARVDQRMITSLRESVKDCSERGLAFASKWSAELLVSIPAKKLFATPSIDPVPFTSTLARPRSSGSPTDPDLHLPPHPHAPRTQPVPESVRLRELELEIREGDFLTTALKCFEHREFPRAVYWLHECRSAKALFLSVYSQYMVCNSSLKRMLSVNHRTGC
jgi:anaphase-promoting complex subunit 8